ncbi:QRFP-like peptide receptor isoform X2 [Rhodnius prolixus]|uniref:QRFP-like peptide receptor isoform X2 n=1 Tax=Rhodnius prolixus TaxID=13249 RepID=UPI003D18FB65
MDQPIKSSGITKPTKMELQENLTDDYDYDVQESFNTYIWEELVPTLVVYILTLVIGVTGNFLIIFTIARYRRMKSITNVFLASLASADLLLILVCIPVKLAKLFSFTWTMGVFLCKMMHYMQSVSAICSVFTLTAMSVERYYAIVHPMKAKYVCTISQARKIIFTTWVASFFLAVPILFVQVQMPVGGRIKAYWCVRDWDWVVAWRCHEVYMLVLVLLLPASVMTVTYSAICREIFRVMQRRFHMTSGKATMNCESFPLSTKEKNPRTFKPKIRSEEENNTVKQVIKMLVAVVIVFILCWAPVLVDNVLTSYDILPHIREGTLKQLATYFQLLAYFNSCVNPLVYGFMSKNFRESFSKALCCRRKVPRRQLSVSHTRTTSLINYKSSKKRKAYYNSRRENNFL